MPERIKVCLIDEEKHIRKQIEDYMYDHDEFELAGAAADGRDGARLLRSSDFDAAIISAILPYRDGITIMKEYKTEVVSRNAVFAILIPASHEPLIRSIIEGGADCSFTKPSGSAEIKILFDRITDIHKSKAIANIPTLDEFSNDLLRRLGISSNLKGHKYLKSAITRTVSNRSVTEGMTKILYPGIAKENATTSSRVERDIRHAISESWKNGSSMFAELLKYESFRETRPTNRDFIVAAAKAFEQLIADQP